MKTSILLFISEVICFSMGARSKSVNISTKPKPTQDPNAAEEADMEAAIYAQLELDLAEKSKVLEDLAPGIL